MMMRGYSLSGHVANMLRAARAEATRLDCGYVSPELLLLGMMDEEGTLGARVLTGLGMAREVIAREMQTQIARLPRYDAKVRGLLPYTSAAKRALEGAMDEASELGDDYVDTGHLLLGILRDSESAAAKILAVHDVTRERVRKELERLGPSS